MTRPLAWLPIGRLGVSTVLSTLGLTARALLQAAYLVMLSRWLGPHDYGLFAGSVAAAVLLAPLAGWGIFYLVSERIARGASAPALWGAALVQVLASSALLAAVLLLAHAALLDARVAMVAMLMIAGAELLALPIAQVATGLFQAAGHARDAAAMISLVPACRVLAVGAALVAGIDAGAETVAALHFAGSLLGLAITLAWVAARAGRPVWPGAGTLRELGREGTPYAFGALVGLGYREIDKVFLLQLVGATVAGTYTAAARVIGILVLPIMALVGAALPRLFAATDPDQRSRMLRAMAWSATGYGLLAMALGLAMAPFMPWLFGAEYADASHYVTLLAPWVPLFALHQCLAVGLTSAGRQKMRVGIDALGLAWIVALNLVLLPLWGGDAAVLAMVSAEVLMIAAGWLALRRAR